MEIHQIYTESTLRNFTYIIEADGGNLYCVDPFDAMQVIENVEKLGGKLVAIINTHEHWDHTQGNVELLKKYDCEIWAHENGKGKVPGVTRLLSKGEIIRLSGQYEFEVLDTPGHTFAHLCLMVKKRGIPFAVFTGDTLFNAGVGNCHNGGDPEVLYETISSQFQNMADSVKVYPGHEYLGNNLKFTLDREPGNEKAREMLNIYQTKKTEDEYPITNMGNEKQINTFLRLKESEVVENLPGDTSDDKQVFLRLRELRNDW